MTDKKISQKKFNFLFNVINILPMAIGIFISYLIKREIDILTVGLCTTAGYIMVWLILKRKMKRKQSE